MHRKDKKDKKIRKKGEKNIALTLFKIIAVILIIAIQLFFMGVLYSTAGVIYQYFRVLFEIIKIVSILYILYHHDSSAYKISWILFIMFLPIAGIIVYLLWGNSKLRKKKEIEIKEVNRSSQDYFKKDDSIEEKLLKKDIYKYNQAKYISKVSGYPIYENEDVVYFESGEKFFENLKKDLMNAKKYILLEFYILSSGKLADDIIEILEKKVKEGVEVELIIDSLGSMFKAKSKIRKKIESSGINLYIFNPLSPIINGYINYRNHRKVIVIDGEIAYTGGVNLADEYANIIKKFGYWKDSGIRITGDAVFSFTAMFLRDLEQIVNETLDFDWYKTKNIAKTVKQGFILPIADGPDNRENPIENLYIQTINYAKKSIYISTPYFITSETFLTALLNSARSGIDVKIIVPHIPDKKIVFAVTRSYYEVLLEAGVKVYEYKPGFIHAKALVADDDTAIIGTANIDFRSMNLNFECVTLLYDTGKELDIKEDFSYMTKEYCKEIDLEVWKKRPFIQKIIEAILQAFAPMM